MYDYSYFPTIDSECLLLRQLSEDDARDILAEFSHPEVTRHINPDPPVVDMDTAKTIIGWFNALFDNQEGWRWGIELKSKGELIGTCGFHRWRKEHRCAEIGYDFQYDYWGKGFASEAVARMLDFGFNQMQLHRIEADCNEDNIGSARVLEKAGFTFEGIWRDREFEHGRFVNLKQYSILEDDYRAMHE
jgi:ribosomal-protein-alanine N-acetyltransferase